ncbi:MAG TPA: activator of (R)-2-hydroxyglutaryl-CoA dehydratase [Phycisphaerae bacterium]|mgnify:CR=1 FL=1|jgi:predicted nucleotide-binding protein (sugar kinase/HSP70/actin superfamily)|nr:activator of (R)-2-hydroxyglutaryl-CoA dehydratase [Phycisphaerae bacterium]HOJ56206.1 activator of (R)-2-hydroxyglutaryl-CoA dehydratase [Phycisphaerae bacterium]HOL28068.1 activator of (R)-2-hydroxyglutaryl-CoA dehydratase [Phycisphaerae bacterium]HPP22426.1 activator of (R)-2-hydroxyglutaryl-CoA dehydratase [Phycisphaerae bacterium]HQA44673.1 activator of (R)-2-hydroxyglutaryl-CoA dehydratase [Phycisphaerae bacterium]
MSAIGAHVRTGLDEPRQVSLPVVGQSMGSEEAIRAVLAMERARLMDEAGLNVRPIAHFRRPAERAFTKAERAHVTVLFGGLTLRHEHLLVAALEGLGYRVALVPTPRKADFQAGKEYGNNGQCNPTYFTVGALVNYLKDLRDRQGLSKEEILRDYVFITAGACGPCRFGMYESEYRLALRNAGFDGFRVLLFQQGGGLNQSELEAGIEFNVNFFLSLLNAILMGDLLNEVAYHVRPYEVVPGRTNEVFRACVQLCQDRLRNKRYDHLRGGWPAWVLSKLVSVSGPEDAAKFLDQLRGDYYVSAFRECAHMIDEEIEVDYTRPKPIVKITGEFWAQTTEGDGNFNMFPFLEREGAEVLVEPIGTWIAYLINQVRTEARDRRGLKNGVERPGRWAIRERLRLQAEYYRKVLKFNLAEKVLVREFNRLRAGLGGTTHPLANQLELQRLGHPYYNSRTGGGEGHLEVAKAIYYCNRDLAHMVLSLKPFGCMPSTQSDGAQAAVVAHYPDLIYLPIETSGEGDVNAHSRVQMALGEAKVKCRNEFRKAVERTGFTLEQIRDYVAAHRELRRPLLPVPHRPGVIGRAANFVLHVGDLMKADPALAVARRAIAAV